MLYCHAVVSFMYGDDPIERTTRVTFAVEQTDDQTYSYAAAWTAPMDNFAKKTGRRTASARLSNDSPSHVHAITTGAEDYHSIFEAVMADAMDKGPCRWTILDITSFRSDTTEDTVPA